MAPVYAIVLKLVVSSSYYFLLLSKIMKTSHLPEALVGFTYRTVLFFWFDTIIATDTKLLAYLRVLPFFKILLPPPYFFYFKLKFEIVELFIEVIKQLIVKVQPLHTFIVLGLFLFSDFLLSPLFFHLLLPLHTFLLLLLLLLYISDFFEYFLLFHFFLFLQLCQVSIQHLTYD